MQDVEDISHPIFVATALYTACKYVTLNNDKVVAVRVYWLYLCSAWSKLKEIEDIFVHADHFAWNIFGHLFFELAMWDVACGMSVLQFRNNK